MAEGGNQKDRKPQASTSSAGNILESNDPFEVIAFLLFFLVLGGFLFNKISDFLSSDQSFLEAARSYSLRILPVSLVISFIFIIGIAYSLKQLTRLNNELKLKFNSSASHLPESGMASEALVNKRWQKVLSYLESTSMSDWKLAIMEADIILEEMVDKIGYKGESLGEKLKIVEKSDFTTIDKAWEAHKIRNTIAHEGADFLITQREAQRVVGLFEEVFREFKYI